MVLEAVTSFGYEVVRQTWVISTILIKQVLLLHLAKLVYDEELNLKHLEEVLIRYSRPTVALMLILGFIAAVVNLEIEPGFKLFSELIALLYYGFLFWKF